MLKSVNMYFKKAIAAGRDITGVIYDPEKSNHFITDSYSIIRLNNNNIKDKKRIDDIINKYGKNEKLVNTIKKYYDNNINNNFNIYLFNFKDIKPEDIVIMDKKPVIYIKEKNIHIDYLMLKRILNISDCKDGSIFISENDPYFINITCKNSNSYLLGIKTY